MQKRGMSLTNSQDKRLAAFGLTPAHLETLGTLQGFAKNRLPALLTALHSTFDPWPEMQAALIKPGVHDVRLAHWQRVVTGAMGEGFTESAERLGSAFYSHDIPGYAVAICHHSVMNGILRELVPQHDAVHGTGIFGRARRQREVALADALRRMVWLDLELLLETYASAESDSRHALLQAMAETIERETGMVVTQVSDLTGQMARTARAMSDTAARTGRNAEDAATAAAQTQDTAQTVAAAAEELTASIGEITRQVTLSGHAAQQAVAVGEQARGSIEVLSQQAEQISRVASIIADIASKTNLLALNATIEAARAGEAGKGFAVVASEVKQLATQTARSTEDISRQITAIRDATSTAVNAVGQMVQRIGEIDSVVATVSDAVRQQGEATAEIARSIGQTAEAADAMSQRIDAVRDAVSESDRQAEAVQSTSATLEETVGTLRRAVVRTVRTSSETVNRRRHARHPVSLPAELVLDGAAPHSVRVLDLSASGARLDGAVQAAAGRKGRLRIEGLDLPLSVTHVEESGACGVSLAPAEADAPRLAALLDRASRKAA